MHVAFFSFQVRRRFPLQMFPDRSQQRCPCLDWYTRQAKRSSSGQSISSQQMFALKPGPWRPARRRRRTAFSKAGLGLRHPCSQLWIVRGETPICADSFEIDVGFVRHANILNGRSRHPGLLQEGPGTGIMLGIGPCVFVRLFLPLSDGT
jgi:hypothetical protein